jgi:uncharacterized protein (DUF983 family)
VRALLILRRAIGLRCPRCGGTPLFTGWFAMAPACALCGLVYERAQGYWVGAIYVNYGVTTAIAVTGFFLTWRQVPLALELAWWGAFVVLFPLWFFRYSRSVWLSLEFLLNPEH